MAVCQFIVAITGTVARINNQSAQKALIVFVCVDIFSFACPWGPVAWVVIGEIFFLKVHAKSLSTTITSNWLLNFAIGYATPYMVNSSPGNADMGAKVFFIWGACCLICVFFVWAIIYETKGLSLEEVDELYGKVFKAWKSPGFVPTVFSQGVQDADMYARRMSLNGAEASVSHKRSSQYTKGCGQAVV